MKKRTLVIIPICILILSFFIIKHYLFYGMSNSIDDLPSGELITEYTSPDGNYTIKTYLCGGNATVDFSVRGELITKSDKKKNIYWEYITDKSKIEWINSDTVSINGHEIKLPNGKYDWRSDSN